MLEWLGLIPLLGLQGNWRGYKMGGKAVGGVMSADMKGKFEAARAAGDMDKAKALADKAQAEKPEKQKGKGASAAAAEAKEAKEFSSLIDKNSAALIGMDKKDIDTLKSLNENMTPKEIDRVVAALANIDTKTFDRYADASTKVTGNSGGNWNEFFRQLQKVPTAKYSTDVDQVVADVVKRSKSAGMSIQRVDPAIAKEAGKSIVAHPDLKADPSGFFRRQGEFYEKTVPIIAKRIGDIRNKQIAAQEAEIERASKARAAASAKSASKSKAKPATNDDDFDSMFN